MSRITTLQLPPTAQRKLLAAARKGCKQALQQQQADRAPSPHVQPTFRRTTTTTRTDNASTIRLSINNAARKASAHLHTHSAAAGGPL